ncbi:PREDICTED: serine/threonine-protein kinase HT1-like [Nicotiana attenuata]|uniref:Serinethreonine-protein kinase ht1 n=1 Tax=Nicotiana attenuata TaxID=49451 RepID=A0A314KTI9_NICAT|nr:PREDICTED: serine/threonine-protein kinase HT1-like [Nicotiana attenuata]OIT32545.1 serinethreonine-protein kinase ht1 [Nicotiana attenuata]
MAKTRIRAEIDLRRMDEQLERHLDRVFNNHKCCESEEPKVQVIKKEEWELDCQKIKVKNLIGQGAYGSVYKGVYNGKEVAVKILDLRDEDRRAIVTKAFTQEVSIWYNLSHPNIAKLIGASKNNVPEIKLKSENSQCRPRPTKDGYCIVVEFVPRGTLKSYLIKNHIKKLPLHTVIKLALDVAKGLSYLHSQKIVHRDVKTENLLLDNEGRVKIIDFGVSRVEASCPIDMTGQNGTMGYMAPEVLACLPYDHKCDVYSFGICLWEIYSCSMPYPEQIPLSKTSPDVYKSRRPEIPKSCPSVLADIMKKCWDANPKRRPEMHEVVMMLEAIDISELATENQFQGCFCLIGRKGL